MRADGSTNAPTRRDRWFPMPNPFRSIEEHGRFHHRDLDDLDDVALRVEAAFILRLLAYPDRYCSAVWWLRERLAAVDAERRRRNRGGSR
jgi:hypothetical protein